MLLFQGFSLSLRAFKPERESEYEFAQPLTFLPFRSFLINVPC